MKKILVILCGIILFAISCEKSHKVGHFPNNATNFADVNSEFDDYNSDLKVIDLCYVLSFSTNRKSNGNNFDIIAKEVNICWYQENGVFEMYARDINKSDNRVKNLDSVLNIINTPYNELGPYSIPWYSNLFLYANDSEGNYDIKFIDKDNFSVSDIKFLKSDANELYPSFYGKDFFFYDQWGTNINKVEKFIYCSDKEGNFNIYEVAVPAGKDIVEFLKSKETYESVKLNINSSANDKCPSVNGKLLVFSSDRPGGYGGFDLYYSIYQNGSWSNPVNFGDKINTPYDEYRPITLHMDGFDNNLLLFSSNRPGGKGGFDLYYVGIKQMIK